jgi:hypothetical protein
MDYYKLIIATFIITGLWDVMLRFISLNNDKIPMILPDFIVDLKPYFQHHTLLSAALIAGFVGATTQPIIIYFMNFPTKTSNTNYIFKFMILSFIISALYGFIMKGSKLFPHLDKHYYDKLGTIRSMYHDGISGLIVQFTLLFFIMYIR